MKISFGDTARVAFEALRCICAFLSWALFVHAFAAGSFLKGGKGEFPSEPLAFQGVQPDILLFYL